MTAAEVLLVLLVVGILFYVLYYFLKDTTGRIAVTRPVESRIDEYLDQRFEELIAEWSLVTRPRLRKFKKIKSAVLQEDEAKIAEMKTYEKEMKKTLEVLEERLDALEKELAKPEKGRRKRKS
jgi:ABC-type ATPase with predicted acetyltransferase domain